MDDECHLDEDRQNQSDIPFLRKLGGAPPLRLAKREALK